MLHKLKFQMLQISYNIVILVQYCSTGNTNITFDDIFYKKVTVLKYVDSCILCVFYLSIPINVV